MGKKSITFILWRLPDQHGIVIKVRKKWSGNCNRKSVRSFPRLSSIYPRIICDSSWTPGHGLMQTISLGNERVATTKMCTHREREYSKLASNEVVASKRTYTYATAISSHPDGCASRSFSVNQRVLTETYRRGLSSNLCSCSRDK